MAPMRLIRGHCGCQTRIDDELSQFNQRHGGEVIHRLKITSAFERLDVEEEAKNSRMHCEISACRQLLTILALDYIACQPPLVV
jgi:hypothetical protein